MSAIKLIPSSGGGSVSLVPPSSTSGADVNITLPTSDQGFGRVLQIQNALVNTIKSSTTDVPNLSTTGVTSLPYFFMECSITPLKNTNKIIVQNYATIGCSVSTTVKYIIYRTVGSTNTPVAVASTESGSTASGNRTLSTTSFYAYNTDGYIHNASSICIDQPSASQGTPVTYKVGVTTGVSSTIWINRSHVDGNSAFYPRGTSGIVLMEVAV